MEKKESQNLFSMKTEGNSLIQLKNGNLLIYSFNRHYKFNIYKYRFNKFSIKEIEDNLLLIGNMTFLIEVKLYEKSFDIREVKLQDIIVDINELSDKRLIVITKSEIIILLKENNEYIIKEEYPIDKNWNIGFDIGYTKDSEQYFHSYELPKNRIVIPYFQNLMKMYH